MIISITGTIGTGKDTMADYLVKEYGFVKISMPDPMKRIVKEVYEFSDEQLWGPSDERNTPDERYPRGDGTFLSARIALQLLGNEWSRVCYPETWSVYLRRIIEKVSKGYFYSEKRGAYTLPNKTSQYAGIVVPSCRFRNELEAIKTMGGKTVRLKRDALTVGGSLQIGVKNHATEVEQISIPDNFFDQILHVPEGYEAYYKEIDRCMEVLGVVREKSTV